MRRVSLEPISKTNFGGIFKCLTIMRGGFCRPYRRLSGQKSQRSRMGKDAGNSQKVFLRWALVFFLLAALAACRDTNTTESAKSEAADDEIFYYVVQRSFFVSNGDKHGDLKGFTSKLDYLRELGVSSILMLPLQKSIFYHNYFADDFKVIDEEFGSMADYQEMIAAIHNSGMKFYMDMEVQYVTKNHVWYKD